MPPRDDVLQSIVSDLTPAQKAAVEHKDGPLLVVAGAGSGKTRVITRRVAHLVATGVPASRILAITFTNKAAGEMRERIGHLLGDRDAPPSRRATVSTFHSFAARLLRAHGPRIGLDRGFTILDEGDQRAAIREAMAEAGADPKLFPPPQVAHAIGRAKDTLTTPDEYEKNAFGRFEQIVARTYVKYDALLRGRNALDFDDLLVLAVKAVRDDEETRARLHDRFGYILIDEYQDTNHAQYELAKLLAQRDRNICATGDPDQSIYGWRGADLQNILRFTEDWKDAKVVTLERNYRSTKIVCRAANALIQHNKLRVPKELVTENDEGAPVRLLRSPDGAHEARTVARLIEEEIAAGASPGEIAVFYRANALSREMEQALFERGVPYVVIGALEFYERKEVKDLLAYLRVLVNPKDDVNLLRVLSAPPRGVGKSSILKLKALAKERDISLIDAIERAGEVEGLPKKARAALAGLPELFARLRERVADGAEAVLATVIAETSYLAYLKEYFPEEEDRGSNVEALLDAARVFDRRASEAAPPAPRAPRRTEKARSRSGSLPLFAAAPDEDEEVPEAIEPEPPYDPFSDLPPGVEGFLEQVALISAQDASKREDERAKVSLMTVHTAKGLEFDAVFVIGLEDGSFPNSRAMEDGNGLEEERRLAYVAITRAKKRLVLSWAEWRSRWGQSSEPRRPSGFIFELPDDVFEGGQRPRVPEAAPRFASFDDDDDPGGDDDEVEASADDDGVDAPAPDEDAPRKAWNRPLVTKSTPPPRPAAREEAPAFAAGDRVRHELFGVGRVLSVSGSGPACRVRVDFMSHGEKNLVLQYARLTKVER
jgi:DNA helicase-2/ATP-dependent DNA helicase PcrA